MAFSGPAKNINVRASKALDSLALGFAQAAKALPPQTLATWARRVRPRRCDLLDHVDIEYELKNSFWARVYDTHVITHAPLSSQSDRIIEVAAKYSGVLKIESVHFVSRSGDDRGLSDMLDREPRIAQAIHDLNLTRVTIVCSPSGTRSWTIDTTGFLGSYTWNFLPPIAKLIRYKEDEVHQHLKLLAMMRHIVSRCDD